MLFEAVLIPYLSRRMTELEYFRHIHTLIFDVDGVLTNSELIVLENGHLLRKMSTRDGYALKLAVSKGLRVVIITGGTSTGVAQRLKNLGVTHIFSGVQKKVGIYEALLDEFEFTTEDEEGILYMGDDLPDYEVMRRVGFPVCPADAVPEVRQIARYISPFEGGRGCVRDVIEKVMKLKRMWPHQPKPVKLPPLKRKK